MLIQKFKVLTAVLFTTCFRLSWLSFCFQARDFKKKLLNATKQVLGSTGMKVKKIYRVSPEKLNICQR